jgi:hypothetical protein
MAEGEFSVCQFFQDDSYEYVYRMVDAKTAVEKAKFYTSNVAARIGMTKKVIITDGLDLTVFEWRYGEGVVFPPRKE